MKHTVKTVLFQILYLSASKDKPAHCVPIKSSQSRSVGFGVLLYGRGADGAILHHGPYVRC